MAPSGTRTLERNAIAAHEAGHAVISRVLQLPSGKATIDGKPGAYLQDDHGLASLLTAMAGSAAERELVGVTGGMDGDWPKVMRLLDALGVDSDTCWTITRQLVELHRDRIAAVAQALLQHGELSGAEIDAIVEREGG
jgi:ATP-dependent Zn protease